MKHSPIIALKFRDFRLLWLGMLISRIGSEMQTVAVGWQMYNLTHSPLSLGLIGLARFLPVLMFTFFAGVIADYFNRKKIMFIAQFVMMISAGILAYLTFTNNISPLPIYILLALNSAASIFDTPARQATVPLLVPREYFMNAVSLSTIMWQSAIVTGPALSGFIIEFGGLSYVYLLNAFSFLGVMVALILMSPIKQIRPAKNSLSSLCRIKEGIHFVKNSPLIYSTMLLDFIATFFASATTLLPIFAKDILKVGASGLGFLYAAPSIGGILAGVIISALGHFKHQGKVLLITVTIYGFATILFGLSKSYYLSLVFLAIAGAGDIISSIIRNTIRQLNTPDYIRGRVSSVNMLFVMGGPQLGEVESGIAAALLTTPVTVVIGGAGTIIATFLIGRFIPKIRNFQGDEVLA